MSAANEGRPDRAALQHLLDVYGGDSSRWPDGSEHRFAPLLASDPLARACVAEARALDGVLARAPESDGVRQRQLANRIFAAFEASRPAAGASVVSADRTVVDLASARRSPIHKPTPRHRAVWQAAGVLAASLIVGVFVGQSGNFGTSFDDVAALVGWTSDTDTLTAALDQTVEMPADEEAL